MRSCGSTETASASLNKTRRCLVLRQINAFFGGWLSTSARIFRQNRFRQKFSCQKQLLTSHGIAIFKRGKNERSDGLRRSGRTHDQSGPNPAQRLRLCALALCDAGCAGLRKEPFARIAERTFKKCLPGPGTKTPLSHARSGCE